MSTHQQEEQETVLVSHNGEEEKEGDFVATVLYMQKGLSVTVMGDVELHGKTAQRSAKSGMGRRTDWEKKVKDES